ncbi:ice-binding family protein [Polaribacter glomeratus]|uniref:DUF3494 domain-containing protein n=1 Tax=Polaribacter glomeratus TaxID=102 RepID=A0A2S7WHG0_9FLAO|nr:ice-binding family protein [Polaribacter glomeratus]PQJ76731.1 hypothetical protein BTO16_12685 [Polaribacter glomeratus]TXD67427.1 DUF3494 domain-containing protein [Polaribacter glomeratus]
MKLLKLMPILAMFLIGVLSSCDTAEETTLMTPINSSTKTKLEPVISSKKSEGINLGVAGEFVILTKSGITNVRQSDIKGDVGTSPITGAALLLTCEEVTGTIYTVNAAGPACKITAPSRLSTAVGDMETAYTDIAGRASSADKTNLGAGNITGMTLSPGVYKWTSAVLLNGVLELKGNEDSIFIFQIAETFDMGSGAEILLTNGVQAKNIFWQTAGAVTLGTTSSFQGSLLGKTSIAVQTGASVNGRLLAQTAVTLQMNSVKMPN